MISIEFGAGFSHCCNQEGHMETHTGENCKECGSAFLHTGHLMTHIRTHNGETPFSCNKCDL